MESWVTQVRKGVVELGVLAVLRGSEAYGYEIVRRLAEAPGLEVTESTVYPVLARLAKDGCLAVRSAPSPQGPPRRYYRLTESGQSRLESMTQHWRTIRDSVERILNGDQR